MQTKIDIIQNFELSKFVIIMIEKAFWVSFQFNITNVKSKNRLA